MLSKYFPTGRKLCSTLMIVLRDVAGSDESMYQALQSDLDLTDYLSRFCPYNSSVANYDTSKVCWFIIEEDTNCIGSIWLERDAQEPDTVILGIFISGKNSRGRGIGSYAIKEAIRISKQRMPFRYVRLNVRRNNLRQKNAKNGAIIDYYRMIMKVED